MKQDKNKRKWHKNFQKYTEMIVSNPNYKGLPYERDDKGKIKWVVTGKSEKGQERKQWWDNQCKMHSIKIEPGCYAKIAAILHPTKMHVCQICGRSLSIEYIYPNKTTLKRINALLGSNIEPYSLSVFELIELFGDKQDNLLAIKKAFKIEDCKVGKELLGIYIFKNCHSMLSPGVMSNCPDRYDGFHSDGNCCRSVSDKGRNPNNLERYSQDRRAYENWADGNWKMADRLMAEFSKNGVSADHIGPISLGFCHRPKFQPMSKSENSAKNNRLRLEDVQTLIADEIKGECVVSWHSKYLWDKFKYKVKTDSDAVKLSKLMRTNLHHILSIFAIIYENGYGDFLKKFLHPEYSFYDYKFSGFDPKTGSFKSVTRKKLTGKNQQNNADRYVRISFESLDAYKSKGNRKQLVIKDDSAQSLIKQVLIELYCNNETKAEKNLKDLFKLLAKIAESQW